VTSSLFESSHESIELVLLLIKLSIHLILCVDHILKDLQGIFRKRREERAIVGKRA